jgi:hypothetical protein
VRVWFLDFHRDPPPQVHRSLRLRTKLPHPFQSKVLTDFFEAIENERTTIFNLQPGRCVLFTTVDHLSGLTSLVSSSLSTAQFQQSNFNPFQAAGSSTNPFPQFQVPTPIPTDWRPATSVHCCTWRPSAVVEPFPDIPQCSSITNDWRKPFPCKYVTHAGHGRPRGFHHLAR